MLKLDNFKNTVLNESELVLLQGGKMRYFIGDQEVSKEIYKDFYKCKTGLDSKY